MTELIPLYRHIEDYFFKGISLKTLDLRGQAHAYMTGAPHINFIYITKKPTALENILAQGASFFDQVGLSFEVIIPQDFCTPPTMTLLNKVGYIQTDQAVAMMLNIKDLDDEHGSHFHEEITVKVQDEHLDAWVSPLIDAFGCPVETGPIYKAAHERALKKGVRLYHFTLFQQERPVASITLSLWGELARLDDVGTLPAFQGKGYATLLIRHVLSKAKKRGAHYCFLESSASGLRLYEKLGFTPLFNNNVYAKNT